jgi:hypothetical protein
MDILKLKNKKILVFGKSRAFSKQELQMQLKIHRIALYESYEDDVDYIVDGAMMTPDESRVSEELYKKKESEFLSMETLEKLLTSSIDEDALLMSLKLSNDKQRLKNFLTNPQISDALYLRLLNIYNWGDDDFYENDDNRDISASLIKRFYKNIQRNHNVEFSKLGLMHLILQCEDEKIIQTVANLKPLRKGFKASKDDHGFKIITSIASNINTPKSVLKLLIKESNIYVKTLIAMRKDSDEELQSILYETSDEDVLESLSYSDCLVEDIYMQLRQNENFTKNMAKYIKLDNKKFDFFKQKHIIELVQNENLTLQMQEELMKDFKSIDKENLAKNKNISIKIVKALLKDKNHKVNFAIYSNHSTSTDILNDAYQDASNHLALASNKNTPLDILTKLYNFDDAQIKMLLAKNTSTPVDVLYQLQLDSRYEKFVKENPSFGEHIQKENIGWLV